MSGIWHTKPPSNCPSSFKPKSLESFEVIEPKTFNSVRVDSILSFASELANWHSNGARQLFFTTSFRPKESLILEVYKAYRNSLRQAHDIKTGDLSFSLVLQCITPGMLAHSTRSGPHSLGLKPKDGPLAVVLLYPRCDSVGDDLIITKICEELIQSLQKLAVDADSASKYRFLNYAYGVQKVFEGYGDESLRVLQEVSHTYDPYGLFQRNVSGGFKIREVSTA